MRRPDHDFGRYATNVDAGSADGAALNQRHPGTALRRFQGRSHGTATAANHRNVQVVVTHKRYS